MVRPAKVTASASGRSPLPWHSGQGTLRDEPQRPLAHPLALGVGEHVHDVLAGAPELPVVAVVDAVALGLDRGPTAARR